jgi:acyl-CoA thioester hydrolase
MPSSFEMTRQVAFSETDAAGIVHFANFFRYMEDAEHAFLRSLAQSVHHHDERGLRGFPRVAASCRYHQPLRFEDRFTVRLTVRAVNARSLTYAFVFRRPGETQALAEGEMTVVYVERPSGADHMRAAELPRELAEQIQPAPE